MAFSSGIRLRKAVARVWMLRCLAGLRTFSSERPSSLDFSFSGSDISSKHGDYWMALADIQQSKAKHRWNLVQQPKHYSGFSGTNEKTRGREEDMASQMINYALSSRNKGDSASLEALRVLEQGLAFFNRDMPEGANAVARVLFTMATLHADNKKIENALEDLERVMQLPKTSLEVRVSALEALAGLKLRMHQDAAALALAQALSNCVDTGGSHRTDEHLKFRSTTTSNLVKIASGDLDKVDLSVSVDETYKRDASTTPPPGLASAVLALAECTHVQGQLSQAKAFYQEAINLAQREDAELLPGLTATFMIPEEVRIGALVGLGQLSANLGQFDEAEKNLTEALKQAEAISGEKHAKVGMVLSCMGHVYARRGEVENTGYLLAEGLYRRALDILEAPPLDTEDFQPSPDLSDMLVISRGWYASLLTKMNRKSEAERLEAWAKASWKGSRPFEEILSPGSLSTIPKPMSVVDIRLGRVL